MTKPSAEGTRELLATVGLAPGPRKATEHVAAMDGDPAGRDRPMGLATSRDHDVPFANNTHPADPVGVPAVTHPCDRTDGLPVGLRLVGGEYDDRELFGIARAIGRHAGVER